VGQIRLRRLAACIILGNVVPFLVGSCAPTSYRIGTHPASDVSMTARFDGVVSGRINSDGTACLWTGDGADRHALIWPAGYVARGNPVAVYDPSGTLVVVAGQKASLGGGLGPDGNQVTGCSGISHAWVVGTVIR
jgi:hypothetical protein